MRTPTVEIPTDEGISSRDSCVLLEEVCPQTVERHFEQLLQQGPPTLCRIPTVELPIPGPHDDDERLQVSVR
jgi:hypothetical protein